MQQLLNNLDTLKEFFIKNPISKENKFIFKNKFESAFIFNSNAIENNSLTLQNTKHFLNENKITVNQKIQNYIETKNHKNAWNFLKQLLKSNEPLNSFNLKNIHYLLLKNIDNNTAGNFRNHNIRISGTKFIPPMFNIVAAEIDNLLKNHNKDNLHSIIKAVKLHTEFVRIHPFSDGNGRTARLLLNYVLLKNNFLPVIIYKHQQNKYYDCLEAINFYNNYTQLNNLVIHNLFKSYDVLKQIISQ